MAATAQTPVAENVIPKGNVIEDMISNLTLDVEARDENQEQLDKAEEFISEADDRILKAGQALSFMTDYMTPEQIEIVNGLDLYREKLEISPEKGSLNEIAQQAFDTLKKSKNGEMTNGELYEDYENKEGNDAIKYGMFNIKLRSLFSSMKLIRVEPEGAKSSREHIICVNGFKAGKN